MLNNAPQRRHNNLHFIDAETDVLLDYHCCPTLLSKTVYKDLALSEVSKSRVLPNIVNIKLSTHLQIWLPNNVWGFASLFL